MEWLKALLTKNNVGEEVVTSILEATKDTQYVPKSRLDDEINKKKDLETEIVNRDKQIKDLSKLSNDNEALTKKLADLETSNSDWKNKYDVLQLDTAIKLSITDAHNLETVLKLLPREGLELQEGKVKGLDDVLTKMKTDHAYLFKAEDTNNPNLTGFKPNNPPGKNNSSNTNPWAKESFNLTEQGRIMNENPELANQLMAQAK
ncbi:phage scaffolding protein [Bacillus sp. AFS017336]|uniref:phage scaffolding protein n=1 Tax=Bacillus sp. AFS017336 TaxID=2033489 RepID=UPI000BEF8ADC|nr:phage scaffolding protein [Bacillus sp. AFS017336]PEL12676.1 hypothetical protein CN601_06935 [Bacillus sp. AFS017336]